MKTYSRRELEDALPDYLFGVASTSVAEAIEALAARDADFAGVLETERRIAAALDEPREFELDRAPEHDFTRLKARIEEDRESPWWTQLQGMLRPLSAFAVAAVAVGLFMMPADDTGFRTLSDGGSINAGQIRVIFKQELSAEEVERFAQRHSIHLEAGPDMAGSYLFSVDDSRAVVEIVGTLREDDSLSFVGEAQ